MFTQQMMDDLNLLVKFPTESMLQGIKVHHDADQSVISACNRLYANGIISQEDGGYLTDLGQDLSHHANVLMQALKDSQ